MTNVKRILKLTKLWYRYVNMNHHKDIDCHWYIQDVWSYGAMLAAEAGIKK